MDEIIFVVTDEPEGGFTARALGRPSSQRLTTWSFANAFGMRCSAISTTARLRR